MESLSRKRNVSDGDSGFDSALSSRSSSISLEESPEFGKLFDHHDDLSKKLSPLTNLREEFATVLTTDETIEEEQEEDQGLFVITNKVTGVETLFKPPSRLRWSPEKPRVAHTFSAGEYERCTPIPRSHIFHSRLAWELEKQLDKLELIEVDLVMNRSLSPPPSLGIRVIGVNMIHGVQDKLNIYVKRVMDNSVAGEDGRIQVNDHIVSVNGISLVGVSQKLAAQTLSNCAICPETGTVHFVLGRPSKEASEDIETKEKVDDETNDNAKAEKPSKHNMELLEPTPNGEDDESNLTKFAEDLSGDKTKQFTKPKHAFPGKSEQADFEGRDAIRLKNPRGVMERVEEAKQSIRLGKLTNLARSQVVILVTLYLAVVESNV